MAYINGPKLITDSLLYALDVGNPKCYDGVNFNNLAKTSYSTSILASTSVDTTNQGSIIFDGSSATLATSPGINLVNSDYTVMAWIRRDVLNATHGIISDLQFAWWGFWVDSSNRLNLLHRRLADNVTNTVVATTPTIGSQWTHVAGSFNQLVGLKLYVNGQLVASNSSTVLFTLGGGRGPQYIGQYRNSTAVTSNVMNGRIANLLLYNKELNQIEILQNFNATRGRYGV